MYSNLANSVESSTFSSLIKQNMLENEKYFCRKIFNAVCVGVRNGRGTSVFAIRRKVEVEQSNGIVKHWR